MGQLIHARYDDDADAWTELTRDLHLLDAGLVDDRYLVGSVDSDAGRALAAYDLETDALLVSDDACLTAIDAPFLTAGGTLYAGSYSGDWEDTVYTLTPLVFAPGD